MAQPTSTVLMPSRVAVMGPMVDPHGCELRDTKVCIGTSASAQAAANEAAPMESVA